MNRPDPYRRSVGLAKLPCSLENADHSVPQQRSATRAATTCKCSRLLDWSQSLTQLRIGRSTTSSTRKSRDRHQFSSDEKVGTGTNVQVRQDLRTQCAGVSRHRVASRIPGNRPCLIPAMNIRTAGSCDSSRTLCNQILSGCERQSRIADTLMLYVCCRDARGRPSRLPRYRQRLIQPSCQTACCRSETNWHLS